MHMMAMVIREYPEEIKKAFEKCKPYENRIKDGILKDAPPDVIEAFELTKKWVWEMGQ